MRRVTRGTHRRVRAPAIVLVSVVLLVSAPQPLAGAESSSSSRVVGRGDILTTILLGRKAVRRSTARSTAPRCRDVTFTDNDIEMLIGAISWDTETDAARRYAALVSEFILVDASTDEDGGSTPTIEFDLVARYCDGAVEDIRAVPRTTTSLAQQIARSMITRLPQPVVHQSPPEGDPVPVGEPVFLSVDPMNWTEIHATLRFGGTTASVRATPVALRTFSGEPGTTFITCPGAGRRFDPSTPLSARLQANLAGSCTTSYRSPFQPDPSATPRLGSISVLWRTEWRTDDGPWNSLGLIPRTLVFVRPVVELATPITRTFYPTPRAPR